MHQKNNEPRISLMRNAPVKTALIQLGLPTMIGMLISALYNAVDAYFVSGLGVAQLGAVSVVFPIAQLIIGLGMMFGAGAASCISRMLGKKDIRSANEIASTALFASLVIGAFIITVILTFLDPLLVALGATSSILPHAKAYCRIYLFGALMNVFTIAMNNILTAEGATRFTMTAMLIGSVTNVVLDPLMIYGLGWGIEGAAIATVISLSASMGFYFLYMAAKKGILSLAFGSIRLTRRLFVDILQIGVPVFLFQLLSSVSMGLTNKAAMPYGDYAVAAMGAVARIMMIEVYVIFGFLKGFQPFAGYNYAAGEFGRLKSAIHLCLVWSTVFAAMAAGLLAVLAEPAISIFSRDPDVIRLGAKTLRLNAVAFVTFGFQMVYGSLFLSIGRSLEGALISLSRQGIFFLPLIFVLPSVSSLAGVVWAQPLADILAAAFTCIFAYRFRRTLRDAPKCPLDARDTAS